MQNLKLALFSLSILCSLCLQANPTVDMFTAVSEQDGALLAKAIREKADVHAKTELDRTALHIAAQLGNTNLINQLFQAGADVNAQDHTGLTPLHLAAVEGHLNEVQLLLSMGANRDHINHEGKTAAQLAEFWQHVDVALALIAIEETPTPLPESSENSTPFSDTPGAVENTSVSQIPDLSQLHDSITGIQRTLEALQLPSSMPSQQIASPTPMAVTTVPEMGLLGNIKTLTVGMFIGAIVVSLSLKSNSA